VSPVPILWVLLASAVVMLLGWLVQRKSRNAGIVDVLWAACMSASALYYGLIAHGAWLPRLLVAMMGGFWGFRLCMHLLHRVLSEQEDGRYRYLRDYWQDSQARFLGFFMAQALLAALFSIPFYVAASNPVGHSTPWTFAAIATWLVSIGGESVADLQLARFRAVPANAGRTCRSGLWRYSRHPNYFFEWLHWFSYVFLAIGVPYFLCGLAWLGPLLMLATLCWVSGIPFAEAQALRTRGEDYRDYQRQTSMLVPWPPRTGT
jgi:steroid 5-alpha reductase family enzyme